MTNDSRPGISVFFPAYNDAGTIASMVISALLVLETLADDYEVIVVDDGSADSTGSILDRLAADYERVRVVHHPHNRGYGGALRTGFASATKELVFYTDGDYQYDVRDLARLYPLLAENVDVVQGYKTNRSDSRLRLVVGKAYHHAVRLAFGLQVRDVDCDFRLMRRSIFERIDLTHNSGVICVELVRKMQNTGCRIVETGVPHYPRVYGHSQFFRVGAVTRTLRELFALWLEFHAAPRPRPAEISPRRAPAPDRPSGR